MEAELKSKSDNYIQLQKNEDIKRFYIRDYNGNETGEFLEFNLEDIELPLRYQKIIEDDKENRRRLRDKLIIIDKQQDHKGKKLMSSNEEAKIKAVMDFYKREVEIYNAFLGERGIEKLLNGRELSWGTLAEIDTIIAKTIVPELKVSAKSIKEKIMNKYSNKNESSDVLE